jgi:hypothetical protein
MRIIMFSYTFPFSKNFMREVAGICILFLVVSCTSEKQVEQNRNASGVTGVTGTTQPLATVAPGTYALELSPKAASRDETVNLSLAGFAIKDTKIEWLLNGAPAESVLPDQFRLLEARKGDTLQARVSFQGREILSNKIDIVNAPPEITSIKIFPEVFKPGDALSVAAAGSDPDGDNVTFLYAWKKNGESAGASERIDAPLKRGDRISVTVTPYDGESYGRPIALDTEIQNLPPVIQDHKEFQFDGARYTYQVKASDPDGDTLAYSLEAPSEGMSIDKLSGLLTWKVPVEFKGKKITTVVVTDGYGGKATYVLNITIQ